MKMTVWLTGPDGTREISPEEWGADAAPAPLPGETDEKPVALPSWTWPDLALLGAVGALMWLGIAWAAGWLS